MAEGVEIVIGPRQMREIAYIVVIIALAVLLIIKWTGGSCIVDDTAATDTLTDAGLNETNETDTTPTTTETDLCTNNKKDQDETDVDCGGDKCDPCGEFEECHEDSDCETDYCKAWKCAEATCDDGVKNQDESNIDCGGKCGGFWYDNICNDDPMPTFSGKVELTELEVETSENAASGLAKIDTIKFKVENGKDRDMLLEAYIYALDDRGSNIFGTDYDGDESLFVPLIEIPLLSQGESHTATVDVGKTLIETDPDDEYEIQIELRDDDEELVTRESWINE